MRPIDELALLIEGPFYGNGPTMRFAHVRDRPPWCPGAWVLTCGVVPPDGNLPEALTFDCYEYRGLERARDEDEAAAVLVRYHVGGGSLVANGRPVGR